jgi:hypothetical protein
MNIESYAYQPAPPPSPVRWTLVDLILIGALTVALSAVLVILVRLSAQIGIGDLRDAITNHPLIASLGLAGALYLLAVIATGIVIVGRGRGSWREIGFRAPPLLPMLLTPLIFAVQMTALIVVNLSLTQIIGQFENPQLEAFADPSGFTWSNFAVAFVVVAIIAPIVEEMIFRGLLYQWLRARTNVVLAVIGTAAIFSAAHVIPVLLPALFAVGLVLTLAFEWSRSLWVTITLHFFQNALAISLFFYILAHPELVPQT